MKAAVSHREAQVMPPRCRAGMLPMGSAMFSDHAWAEIARSLKLSVRELQIVRGIFDNEKDLAIAQRIGISLSTVHTHVERLHHKLAITGRTQLLLVVMQAFLALTVSPDNDLPPHCAKHMSRGCPYSR